MVRVSPRGRSSSDRCRASYTRALNEGESMRHTLAIALLFTACAPAEDAWLGSYSGAYGCTGRYTSDGERFELSEPQTIEITQRSDGAIFINGGCDFDLELYEADRARMLPRVCPIDGGELELVSGSAELDGARLTY